MEKSKIVLLGYMGSGKSAVAKHIARERNLIAIDLDTYIEQKEALPIRQVFAKHGEIYFRKKEYEYLLELLGEDTYDIISLGGGTPCYYDTMEQLNQHKGVVAIYLKTSIGELTRRLFEEKSERPLIAHLEIKAQLTEFIGKHLFERNPYYQQATLTVLTDDKSPQEVAQELIARLA